jgi:hypothetical protein
LKILTCLQRVLTVITNDATKNSGRHLGSFETGAQDDTWNSDTGGVGAWVLSWIIASPWSGHTAKRVGLGDEFSYRILIIAGAFSRSASDRRRTRWATGCTPCRRESAAGCW